MNPVVNPGSPLSTADEACDTVPYGQTNFALPNDALALPLFHLFFPTFHALQRLIMSIL